METLEEGRPLQFQQTRNEKFWESSAMLEQPRWRSRGETEQGAGESLRAAPVLTKYALQDNAGQVELLQDVVAC